MADTLDQNGLTLDSYTTILQFIQDAMNAIYAPDGDLINFGSETPDGQFTNILAQMSSDVRQLALNIYNSFDPDTVSGTVQDSRYALNFLTRKAGAFTIQNINITCNQTVTLQGLDGNYNDINAASYTVSDDAGSLWYLIDTTTITAGTHSLPFRSQDMALVQPTIGTITNQVTKVLGVTSVNNYVAPTSLGVEQENDDQFRIRRNQSTSIKGQSNYDAMLGQLLQVDGVNEAKIFVNNTNNANTTVTGDINNGVPPFNIWVIVDGGANSDIAQIIYYNSAGLATYGYSNSEIDYTEVNVTTISGQPYNIKFNRVNPVPLYIRFDLKIADSGISINEDLIKDFIIENLVFGLNQSAETSYVTDIAAQSLLQFNANIYALNVEVSTDGINWTDYIASTSWMNKFVIDASRITITQV